MWTGCSSQIHNTINLQNNLYGYNMDNLTCPGPSMTTIVGQHNHTPTWQLPRLLCSNLGHCTQGWNWCTGGNIGQSTSPSGYTTLFMHITLILSYDPDRLGPPLPPNTVYPTIAQIWPKSGTHLGMEWVWIGCTSLVHNTIRLQSTFHGYIMDMVTCPGPYLSTIAIQRTLHLLGNSPDFCAQI